MAQAVNSHLGASNCADSGGIVRNDAAYKRERK